MNLAETPLFNNKYLADFDSEQKWLRAEPNKHSCAVCHKKIQEFACATILGLECLDCVVANIKNCVEAEKIENYSLPDLRKAMAFTRSLRWRFLFLFRFQEIDRKSVV